MLKSVLLPQLNSIVQRRIIDLHVVNRSHEHRKFPRYAISLGVKCCALDEQFERVDTPFEAVTRDISESGLSLVYDIPIEPGNLSVIFHDGHGSMIEMHVRVTRCEPHGSLYLAAGTFVSDQFPTF